MQSECVTYNREACNFIALTPRRFSLLTVRLPIHAAQLMHCCLRIYFIIFDHLFGSPQHVCTSGSCCAFVSYFTRCHKSLDQRATFVRAKNKEGKRYQLSNFHASPAQRWLLFIFHYDLSTDNCNKCFRTRMHPKGNRLLITVGRCVQPTPHIISASIYNAGKFTAVSAASGIHCARDYV